MSLLPNISYSNPDKSIWAPADIGNLPSQLFQYALPSGTPGGAGTAGVYQTRPINTGIPALDVNGFSTVIPGCQLLNNEIILPPGTYAISASLTGLMETQKARIYDITNNQVIGIGLSVGTNGRNSESSVMAEITTVEPTTIALQFWGSNDFGGNPQCWGQSVGAGDSEIYLQCLITKEN